MSRRILLIANPNAAAGRALGRWNEMLAQIRRQNFVVEHAMTNHPGHAISLAQQAGRQYEFIVAVGGDGTVNEVASGILLGGETGTGLGILPVGTGNDVAQMMGLGHLEHALAALLQGTTRLIDVVDVRCQTGGAPVTRSALLYASVGFAGELVNRTTATVKRLFGPRYCYSVGFFRALFSYRSPRMKVECDGQVFEHRMFLACAGNAETVGGGVMRLSPGARIDDGKLNFSIIPALGRWETIREFPRLLQGTHIQNPKVRYFTGTRLTVESHPIADVQVDGEIVGQTPATFQARPRALKILSAR